ncbi:MAG: YdcF family protein [Casimicrobiaceae bacterium]
MIPVWIKGFVKIAVLPPTGPLILALVGLVVAGRHPRRGRALALIGVALLVLLSLPAVASFLIRCIDTTPAFDPAHVDGAQAIVILGGGARDYAPEYGGVTLSTLSLERVRYGARLARETGLPVLVSGGRVDPKAPVEALLMRDVLTREYGVPVRWVEARSRNTHENAIDSAALLKRSGITHVILVVHSFDVPRARREFAAAGIETIAAPTEIPPPVPTEIGDFLPSAAGLQESYWALYEILANALYLIAPQPEPAR